MVKSHAEMHTNPEGRLRDLVKVIYPVPPKTVLTRT